VLDDDDRARLEEAYRTFGDEVWRAIFAYAGGRRDIADEATSEAFAQAGRRLSRIRRLRPWLFTAAFKIAAGLLERKPDMPLPTPEGRIADQDVELMDLTTHLTLAQRKAFVLRDVLGYTTAEASRLIGSSDVSVRVHLHAARRRLRAMLEEVDG
jgi:DNA-directed RNA polymerase specialized sigma24 family protein